jgi:tRNA A37 threonylcarbamoyladenosine dehydratase
MNTDWLERSRLLLGDEGIERLRTSHVLVVGLGGVGGFAVESLARAGIGHLTLVDGDTVSLSNCNRQLVATRDVLGEHKAQVMKQRVININPDVTVDTVVKYMTDMDFKELLSHPFDYVVDAIDTLSPKINFIKWAMENGHNLVSSMGAGGKMDPTRIQVTDVKDSHGCTLARILRKRLHRIGIREGFQVVFSPEKTDLSRVVVTDERNKRSIVGTMSYMPSMFGGACASVVIRALFRRS